MFDFENLNVYTKAKDFNKDVSLFLKNGKIDKTTYGQLRRASFSIMLNIAEGSGRFTNPDKRNFYVIARGSAFECVAIFDFLKDQGAVSPPEFQEFYSRLEEISKMLYSLIRGLE